VYSLWEPPLPEPRQPRGKDKTCLLKIIWRILAHIYPSRVREIIINVLCVRRNTQRPRKLGKPSKGTRPATNVGSVMFTSALPFLVKVALWTITLKQITGNELRGYSLHLFFFPRTGIVASLFS